MKPQKRTLKSISLTSRYHWSYIGGWLAFTVTLTVLLEFFVLRVLGGLRVYNFSTSMDHYTMMSVAVTVLLIFGLTTLAVLWAHRIAGVHLRTERVFREVAEGDRTVRLRFRESDQLEDLEDAFQQMMRGYQADAPPVAATDEESASDPELGNRRDWRNMHLTSKYHFSYMAIWVVLSIGLLALVYATGLLSLYMSAYFEPGTFQTVSVVASILALIAGGAVLFRSMQTAHRIAGVHIRLIRTFRRVAQGERDLELRFRSYDKLEPLEEAFQKMMKSLNESTDENT